MSTDINFMVDWENKFRIRETDKTLSYSKEAASGTDILISISINNNQVTWWIPENEIKNVANILQKVIKELKGVINGSKRIDKTL